MTLTSNKKLPVIIDCDPGADDFFALIWALILHKRGYIDILAITTSGWNVSADSTYKNAIRACMMIWVDTKIAKWKNKEWVEDASYIHGSDGIGGLSKILPKIKKIDEYQSEDLLIELINKHGNKLNILALWPVSNLARIEKKQKGILTKTKAIYSMGGAFFVPWNVTPVAEFNYRYDAEAAKILFDSWANIICAPLDITTQQVFTMQDLEPILDHIEHKEHKDFLTQLTKFTIGTNMGFRETHYQKGFFIHDANVIAALLYPHLYLGTYYKVSTETKGEFTSGQTVVDERNFPVTETNAFILIKQDKKRFLEAMTEDFKDFDFIAKK